MNQIKKKNDAPAWANLLINIGIFVLTIEILRINYNAYRHGGQTVKLLGEINKKLERIENND